MGVSKVSRVPPTEPPGRPKTLEISWLVFRESVLGVVAGSSPGVIGGSTRLLACLEVGGFVLSHTHTPSIRPTSSTAVVVVVDAWTIYVNQTPFSVVKQPV